jgi:hypothetical protein
VEGDSFHQKIPMKRAIFEESGRWREKNDSGFNGVGIHY